MPVKWTKFPRGQNSGLASTRVDSSDGKRQRSTNWEHGSRKRIPCSVATNFDDARLLRRETARLLLTLEDPGVGKLLPHFVG